LHDRGAAGASVLLGVDGIRHGARERASFVAGNADVPLLVVAAGEPAPIAAALEELWPRLDRPVRTDEAVHVCKRDGTLLAAPAVAEGALQRLTIYSGEQSGPLVRALREAGAAGATTLRGIWGYHGDHAPHGDSFRRLRRHVPVITEVLDTPDRMRGWWPIVDAHTARTGLVTSESVAVRVP
jgi:PII-like signaling protein